MKKNSAFTLRSGNKPSFAKLSGVQKSSTTENVAKMKKSPAKKNGGNTKSHSDPSKRTVYISDNKYGLKTRGTVETQKDMILSSKQKNKNYSLNERGDVVVKTSIVDKRGNVVRTKTKTYKKGTAGYRRMFKKADKIADKSRA